MPKGKKYGDPLRVQRGLFERSKKRPYPKEKLFYKDPLGVAPTLNPIKALRRWRKRRAEKKAKHQK